VSRSRTSGLLLRLYPDGWRQRYGEELEELIVESCGGEGVPWSMRLDVVRGGARERLRDVGLGGDGAPDEQARGGALLVLCAWALFVIGGLGVQKFSEHWQDATPTASQSLPSIAFAVLVAAAACGTVLVLVGVVAALPSLAAFLRRGGWAGIRRRVTAALLLTGVAIVATVALVMWADGLTAYQRDGHDLAYAIGFVAWALLAVGCLLAWTVAAVTTARRLTLRTPTLTIEAWLAAAVTLAMVGMTAATVVWWIALADAAPWFLAGRPRGESGSPLAAQLGVSAALMVLASLLGAAGSHRALRALPRIPGNSPS